MKRKTTTGLIVVSILAAVCTVQAADPEARLHATLDGKPLQLQLVGQYHCHDLDSPIIACFRTPGELEAAVTARIEGPRSADAIDAVSYVRIWENAGFDGASAYLAQDYANLGAIGWNDRITAFQSVNDGAGVFHHDISHLGTALSFCCGQANGNVGSTHNDKFSSGPASNGSPHTAMGLHVHSGADGAEDPKSRYTPIPRALAALEDNKGVEMYICTSASC